MDDGVAPMDWARLQWGGASLGDKRRTARAVRLGASLLSCSDASLPVQTATWNNLRAAYRLLAEPDVTHLALCSPHWEATRLRARQADMGPVLFVQDLTELDYTSHPCTRDLGFIGDGRTRGMELQTTLCVLPGPEPELLGMAYSTVWVRGAEPRKEKEKRAARDARHKETDVWGDSAEAIGIAPSPDSGTRWVSVSDRGSDVFSFLSRALALGWTCLTRSKHDRRIADADEQSDRLHSFARSMAPRGTTSVDLRARPGRAARVARLNLSWSPVGLQPPIRTSGEPIPAWCIRAWEDAPDGLEWILVSTDPVQDLEDVLEKLGWYRHRWLVEEYHKCLKTGCGMEKRQVSTKQSLQALLGFLGVVSVFLTQFKAQPVPACIPEPLQAALRALRERKELDPRRTLREIAMLGGFLGRKADGEPGWQSVWRGWNRLQDIAIGFELGRKCPEG